MNWLFEPARMQFCEATLDGAIAHPADTWTNIGPIIAGIVILLHAKRPLARLLGGASLWTGIASGYFHASNTILGETLDLSGMFMFILSIAALQQQRARPNHPGSSVLMGLVVLGTLILTVLSSISTAFASPMFGAIVVVVVIRGLYDQKLTPWAYAMVTTFLIAWGFWWLDFLHIVCNPNNHILTLHGMWHLLNGLVFWLAYRHYELTMRDTETPSAAEAKPESAPETT
ncbi:ceramidase domain-containing protein [Rhodopirellula sp. SWK7]|uniref:ceramidase domain-containing protein n=1 Tax=Rhodopirellula sp. SWK7 TaxID=595460 RepID=UPI0002BF26AF|nr:ceramidase domain-containing protein [Rhodopirellula sp. SWK7]EMI44455.1 membrane protein [Rhodopirellula sp. SWK7]